MGSKEDRELIKAVREWRPPKKLHPIAMFAWGLYDKHDQSLPPEAIAELRGTLDNLKEDLIALAEACEGVVRFMMLCNHQGDEASAKKVVGLLREYTPLYEPFWEKVGEALENVGSDSRGMFQAFVDRDRTADKVAPTFGDAPPANTTQLKDLTPPARPPPWVKDK